jgi:hypothetical protein
MKELLGGISRFWRRFWKSRMRIRRQFGLGGLYVW